MRLINTGSLSLEEFMGGGSQLPGYAILSHTWEEDEVTFQDMTSPDRATTSRKKGFHKIDKTCELARVNGLNYAWVDTCCIDKSSSAELTEAINSMFQWYRDAVVCYAWLADLPSEEQVALRSPESRFQHSRWFTRGWTLQELIAPTRVQFYDRNWDFRGTKTDLSDLITGVTKISHEVLWSPDRLDRLSVAQRMSWAATRQTTRIEDMAYCLLGIFDVNMPMLYGEGSRAFLRLQEEIARDRNDYSLFAWTATSMHQAHRGVFADHPREFLDSGSIEIGSDTVFNPEYILTNKGLSLTTPLLPGAGSAYLMKLNCVRLVDGVRQPLGIWVGQQGGGVYDRIRAHELGTVPTGAEGKSHRIFLAKRISASRSQELEGKQAGAFILRKNFDQRDLPEVYPDFPLNIVYMQPAEEWDSQRCMFLTHGASEFSAYAYVIPKAGSRASDNRLMPTAIIIAFGTDQSDEKPWVTIGSAHDSPGMFNSLNITEPRSPYRRGPEKLTATLPDLDNKDYKQVSVSLKKSVVEDQTVYCIDLECGDIERPEGRTVPYRQGRRNSG